MSEKDAKRIVDRLKKQARKEFQDIKNFEKVAEKFTEGVDISPEDKLFPSDDVVSKAKVKVPGRKTPQVWGELASESKGFRQGRDFFPG